MIQVNPQDRNSAQHYLEEWRGAIFPEVYYSYLHAFFVRCLRPLEDCQGSSGIRRLSNDSDAEAIIDMIWTDYREIMDWISPASTNQGISLPLSIVQILDTNSDREIDYGKITG
jgi:hypothetical protein